MSDFELVTCNFVIKANLDYTYCHYTLQHYSLVDFFWITKHSITDLSEFLIIDHADNLSDHLPILVKIKSYSSFTDIKYSKINVNNNDSILHDIKKLRWDSADLTAFSD